MRRAAVYLVLKGGILICFLPIGFVGWASYFAERHGCTLNDDIVFPCVVEGIDYGQRLHWAYDASWLLFFTMPVAVLLLALAIALSLYEALGSG
ncbi:MAG: hypothetical protein CML66_05800 [Rhodobacteraceae bacterium]|nr:hypothetical protein [Paracoccaceae bacterium]QEW21457.1 hypothetical protein LA6_003667 [Marinibacterium anthonyi]